ncbi:NAD(P)/FAD-dependent oxidoreductase [Paractinoplanes ferrugineus]|uniref:NADH:ubiquinone reductase (non-electrogenic) n=1 Tax=Paractinoplanes ferrugineus TaxID=113564 RepID=A0A919J580_9ACTN|nr:NAD(P)/FAD-dependent oxidoreductase [Actinoplanes ferrugineus]GIE10821.1 putative NADH dehydrogenase (NDH) [Actinoplanes ferrugineus]
MTQHRVVVVGAGFGGLFATRALRRVPAQVTLINPTTYHLFEPLLYQVATGILSEGEVAPPIREIFRARRNLDIQLGWVTDVRPDVKEVIATGLDGKERRVPYDSLIVAAGAQNSYFGNDGFAEHAPSLKSIDDALEVRGRIFHAFEMAELADDPVERRRWLTFAIVGAGPTGVELAGQIAELAQRALKGQYRHLPETRVVLLDAVDRVLPAFDHQLSEKASRTLAKLKIDVRLGTRVVDVDRTGVTFAGGERLDAYTKIWAAGVMAPGLAGRLAEATGARTDRAGRIVVEPDLTVPGHPEIFVVGDMAAQNLPGVAQVAMQGGRHAARVIAGRLTGKPVAAPFKYFDKGNMATISRFSAVANVGQLHLSGLLGWLSWLGVHLFYLIGFKNKVSTLMHWTVSFLGRGRSERIATTQQINARNALHHLSADDQHRAVGVVQQLQNGRSE